MKHSIIKALAACGFAAALLIPAVPAQAVASGAHHYSNCTDVHRIYSGGIAKAGVKYDKVSGSNRALKGNVKRSTALYNANKSMDRDHDGISCEKA